MELEGFLEVSGLLHCVVYALVYRREVVYVGQSRRPLARLDAHAVGRSRVGFRKNGGPKVGFRFDQVFIRPCMLAELDALETEMIAKYRPKHNQKKLPPASAEEMNLLIAAVLAQSRGSAPSPLPQPRFDRRF